MSGTEDRPINKAADDLFSMHDKFVEPVCNYIGNNSEGAMTIAVSGEWGSGKSSAINLLKERLRGYDLLLMSDLPTDGMPVTGKIYLTMVNERLKYTVKTPTGNIAQGYLNIIIPELMTESLALCKADILADKIELDYLDTNMFELTTESLIPHKAVILAELSKKGHIRSMENVPHNGENKIVDFDPLLEAKFEVPQLVAFFLKELEKSIDDKDVKRDLKDLLSTIALVLDMAARAYPHVSLPIRICKEITGFFRSKSQHPKSNLSFTEKAEEISKKISKKGYKIFIFIFIDEIDRLPSNYIINFLLFCRTLDSFEGLVCIIGLDYKRVLDKLVQEPGACYGDQRGAQDYLDKFFQTKSQILHSTEEKIAYAKTVIEKAEVAHIFSEFDQNDQSRELFKDIIYYLSTPRMIKKFVMTVQSKKAFLENSSGLINYRLFQFIAATIKSPVILDVLSKDILLESREYEENLTFNPHTDIASQIKNDPKKYCSYDQLIGKHFKIENKEDKKVSYTILDEKTLKFIEESNRVPLFILSIYVSGYEDHTIVETLRIVGGGSSDERNDILTKLALPNNNSLFLEVSSYINTGSKYSSMQPADIRVLNDLFEKKMQKAVVSYSNWSGGMIYYFLKLISVDEVILKGSLVLSSLYIDLILSTYDFENSLTSLSDLDKRIADAGPENALKHFELCGMDKVQFKGKNIVSFESAVAVRNMIEMWLEKEVRLSHEYEDTERKYLSGQAEKYRDMLK